MSLKRGNPNSHRLRAVNFQKTTAGEISPVELIREGENQKSPPSAESLPSTQRFLWVDAIRGLACVAVILRHLFHPAHLHPGLARLFPAWLEWLHVVSAAGVYAFFVISGFVIAHSLRNNSLNNQSVVNFIVRRQVRLDPVYWACLLLFLIVPALFFDLGALAKISLPNLVINAVYLQSLLAKESIIGPSWTLCIEIQFYLAFIGILMLGRSARKISPQNNLTLVSLAILFATGLLALLLKHKTFYAAIFISYWHFFAVGALTYYALQKMISARLYAFFVLAFALSLAFSPLDAIADFGTKHSLSLAAMTVALATALSLFYAGKSGKMAVWGNTPILQYLGKISYTLYLIHVLVIQILTDLWAPKPIENSALALGFYFLCFAVSILCAHILHLLVEKPSMKFASRLKTA